MGLFDRQKLYGGKRLQEEFEANEQFVLWDLAVVAENVPLPDSADKVDKTELIVSVKVGDKVSPPMLVSTLSGPIRDLGYQNVRDSKGQAKADDLPCIAHWDTVQTKRSAASSFNDAVILVMDTAYDGKKEEKLPAFSFTPITQESNPLEEVTA